MTSFSERMKSYEVASSQVLPARLPVIIRLDGNSFSKLTNEQFEKPFDEKFEMAMLEATKALMSYCSGCVIGYTQSDEITLVLTNNQSDKSEPFLGNRTQKIASLTAAIASVAFNKYLEKDLRHDTLAVFDSRVYVVPESEVINVLRWRQLDCYRNGINVWLHHKLKEKYGRKKSQSMLHKKNTNEQKAMILDEFDVHFGDLPTRWFQGRVVRRVLSEKPITDVMDSEKYQRLIEDGKIKGDETVFRNDFDVAENLSFGDYDDYRDLEIGCPEVEREAWSGNALLITKDVMDSWRNEKAKIDTEESKDE